MSQLDDLVKNITSLSRKHQTLLIAIDGRGGSGKSTLANRLKEKLPKVDIVHLDDFAYPNTDRQRLLDQVIIPLESNNPANYQRFDWGSKKLAEWHEIKPGGIVFIEGVSTLHDILYKHFDYKIWIECPPEIGFQRGLDRDMNVYKVDTKDDWINKWMPEEKKYVEEHKPQEKANYIIDGTKELIS
jgi:uridine kinase